jgi:dolichol-phosphate mannosyltransferase
MPKNEKISCRISVVVPVYQEENSVKPFLERLEPVLETIDKNYEIVFALDPSPDRTESILLQEIKRNPQIKLLILSRRFGQPAATMAGLAHCTGQTCVIMDVDLQDPPELITDLYQKLREGEYEVVYAQRRSRQGETLLKRLVAHFGYALINKASDIDIPRNTGDFRIITRRVIDELCRLNEPNAFMRGLVAYIGFKQACIQYDRAPRYYGAGHYNRFIGSLKIGLNGLIGFSARPLFLMSLTGLIFSGFSFIVGALYVLQKIMGAPLSPGLPTTVLVVTFFSGIQLLALGLMGEYIGRVYDEVKNRPTYIVDRKINF